MKKQPFELFKQQQEKYQKLVQQKNRPVDSVNGIYQRYTSPVLTAEHVPPTWRFDLDPIRNPYGLERLPVNTVFNSGAIKLQDRYLLMARVEGADRKSFFAVAESKSPVDNLPSGTIRR